MLGLSRPRSHPLAQEGGRVRSFLTPAYDWVWVGAKAPRWADLCIFACCIPRVVRLQQPEREDVARPRLSRAAHGSGPGRVVSRLPDTAVR